MKDTSARKLKGPVSIPGPGSTGALPGLALEKRVAALEAITKPAIIFQLSYDPFGGQQGDAIQVPNGTTRMLLNFNILVLFRRADDYVFSYPTFSCPVWEAMLIASTGIPFKTTGPAFNQVIALGIETNSYSPMAAKPGDTVTMTLKVTSKTDPAVTANFVQKFRML